MIQTSLLKTGKQHRMMLADSEPGEVLLPGGSQMQSGRRWMVTWEHRIGEDRAEEEDLCLSLYSFDVSENKASVRKGCFVLGGTQV